jgi:hypothetical protein
MAYDRGNLSKGKAHTITLEEYRALEAAGRIKRPLTQESMSIKRHDLTPRKEVGILDALIAAQDKD